MGEIDRENLMVKCPGTAQGIPAIRELIGEGININVTLLFCTRMYGKVAEAYLSGLEMLDPKADLSHVASVASFFVSRIDTKVDAAIDEKLEGNAARRLRTSSPHCAARSPSPTPSSPINITRNCFRGRRWEKLAAHGARPQRLLWASTGTKNKAYSDILYVETLIGPDTVNTMPPETMDAYRDHGNPAATLETNLDQARRFSPILTRAGISLDRITDDLVEDGVEQFAKAADKLYGALAEKRAETFERVAAEPENRSRLLRRPSLSRTNSMCGRRAAMCDGYGRKTRRCGPAPMKPNGWAGSISQAASLRISPA